MIKTLHQNKGAIHFCAYIPRDYDKLPHINSPFCISTMSVISITVMLVKLYFTSIHYILL